jgi:hypothetical protein
VSGQTATAHINTVYDGNNTATPTLAIAAAGLVGTETVIATGAATFNTKDVSTANADSKLYDGLAYSGGNGVSYAGFVNGEGLSVLAGALAYGGNSQGAIQAETYSIIPEGLSSANYAISYLNDKLVITQTPVIPNTVTTNQPSETLENPIVLVITKQPIRDTYNLEDQRVSLQVATIFADGKNENEAVNVAYKEIRKRPKSKTPIEIENGGIRLPR